MTGSTHSSIHNFKEENEIWDVVKPGAGPIQISYQKKKKSMMSHDEGEKRLAL